MRVIAVIIRILRQFRHDKRTMALMIVAPIFVLTLMSFIFTGRDYHPKIGIVNAPIQYVHQLEDHDARVIRYSESSAREAIRNAQIDAILNFESGVPHLQIEGSDSSKNKAVLMLFQKVNQGYSPMTQPEITYLYGYEDMTTFDNLGQILIGFFVFFFVFLISGVSFLSERTSGTLERLLATPLRRWELVLGYVLGFGIFAILQSTIIAWYSIEILDIMMVGSFPLVLLITIITAMVALTIGTFISAFANNELQMIQFIPIIIVPQVFFSGLFDLSTMHPWLQAVAPLMPLWYVADALKTVMIRGQGWEYIAFDVYVLIGLCLFFMIANIFILKKYRKI